MSDKRLRELERRYHESQSPVDQARWVQSMISAGKLDPELLYKAAVEIGSPVALIVLYGEDVVFADDPAQALFSSFWNRIRFQISASYRNEMLARIEESVMVRTWQKQVTEAAIEWGIATAARKAEEEE